MKFKSHKLHLRIGLTFLPFLLLSALTGFFRANHKWFWKEDYMKVKRQEFSAQLAEPCIPVDAIFKMTDDYFSKDVQVHQVRLKMEAGRPFYEIKIENEHSLLIDGMTGTYVSPLSEDLVKKISSQYISSDFDIKSIRQVEDYIPRKQKKVRPVYEVSYQDDLETQIFIDLYTGEIVEELDNNLRFGMWMVKLHDYDFWDMKRLNLSLVALGVVGVGFSGFYLWMKRNKKKSSKSRLNKQRAVQKSYNLS